MNAYPVLQSGFVALKADGLALPNPTEPTIRQTVIFKDYKHPLVNYFYSTEVTELFARWSGNPSCLKDFDFRERLLKAAFKAFGTPSFINWLDLQNQKNAISDLHKAFILETIGYIYGEKPRAIQNVQWLRLLEASDKSAKVRVDLEELFGNGVRTPIFPNASASMKEVIKAWVCQPNGFEDLLICLFVIFGERARRTDVRDDTE